MPFKGTLTMGASCRITIDSAPAMPGTSAVAIVWIPNAKVVAPLPIVTSIAPGTSMQRTVPVPDAQMLLVDIDLPVDQVSTVTVTIEEGATTVATGSESGDTEWTFLVVP
jgi:hypothetical protein